MGSSNSNSEPSSSLPPSPNSNLATQTRLLPCADGGALGDGAPRLSAPAPLPIGAAQAVVAVLDSSLAWSRVALELTFALSAALDAGGTVILRLPGFGSAGDPLALNDTAAARPIRTAAAVRPGEDVVAVRVVRAATARRAWWARRRRRRRAERARTARGDT